MAGVVVLAAPAARRRLRTVGDTSVRTYESSPWSMGTLFSGQGFSVGAVRGAWAWGYARGEAQICGVQVGAIWTAATDTRCGDARTIPLGDSERVPGGGDSEPWARHLPPVGRRPPTKMPIAVSQDWTVTDRSTAVYDEVSELMANGVSRNGGTSRLVPGGAPAM